MNPDDSSSLFDSHGNPIRKPESEREALEALIRSELAEAKEKLRQSNKEGLDEIAEKYYKPKLNLWHNTSAYTFAVPVAVILFGWLAVPGIIKTKTSNYISEHLVGAALTNTVNSIITNEADPLIETRLKPLRTNIDFLETRINVLNLDVSNKQAQLILEQKAVREQIHPLFGEVKSMQLSIAAAQAQASKLQEEQKLMGLLNRGEVFDSDAIQQLQLIARGTNENAALAQSMFNKVYRMLVLDRGALTYMGASEGTGTTNQYGGPFSSDELVWGLFHSSPSGQEGIINIMGDSKQKLFVPPLIELATNSKDLWIVNRIGNALNKIIGLNFYAWDLQPLDKWWAQNSMNYTNWPMDQYSKGIEAAEAGRYQEGLTNFEFVLKIDPKADESRALAVVCAIETWNIPKAEQLNTNYAIGDGRWEEWAQGKMMLATNSIQQGTEKLASLAKKYPTFKVVESIREGNPTYRNMDWALYSKLMQPTNRTGSTNIKNSLP